jgi:hypothetical protein
VKIKRPAVIGTVAVVCATGGVLGGIAASSANSSSAPATHWARAGELRGLFGFRGGPGRRHFFRGGRGGFFGGRAVHSVRVVLNKAGTGFDTVTTDSGTVQSVDMTNSRLTIVEGTKAVTYKTVTLSIPTGATIVRDFRTAKLSDLTSGDRATVSASSGGTTTVFAIDSTFHPKPPSGYGTTGPTGGFGPRGHRFGGPRPPRLFGP